MTAWPSTARVLLPLFAASVAIYLPTVWWQFGSGPDMQLFYGDSNAFLKHPETMHLFAVARPLGGILLNLQMYFVEDIFDFSMVRLASILLLGAYAVLLALTIARTAAIPLPLAGVAAFLIVISPPFHVAILDQATMTNIVCVSALATAAFLFADRAMAWLDTGAGPFAPSFLRLSGAGILCLVAGFYVYPLTALIYLVLLSLKMLFVDTPDWGSLLRRFFVHLGIFFGTALGALLLFKYALRPLFMGAWESLRIYITGGAFPLNYRLDFVFDPIGKRQIARDIFDSSTRLWFGHVPRDADILQIPYSLLLGVQSLLVAFLILARWYARRSSGFFGDRPGLGAQVLFFFVSAALFFIPLLACYAVYLSPSGDVDYGPRMLVASYAAHAALFALGIAALAELTRQRPILIAAFSIVISIASAQTAASVWSEAQRAGTQTALILDAAKTVIDGQHGSLIVVKASGELIDINPGWSELISRKHSSSGGQLKLFAIVPREGNLYLPRDAFVIFQGRAASASALITQSEFLRNFSTVSLVNAVAANGHADPGRSAPAIPDSSAIFHLGGSRLELTKDQLPVILQIEIVDGRRRMIGYSFQADRQRAGVFPRNIYLDASDDGITWAILDRQTMTRNPGPAETVTFNVATPTSGRFFRFRLEAGPEQPSIAIEKLFPVFAPAEQP